MANSEVAQEVKIKLNPIIRNLKNIAHALLNSNDVKGIEINKEISRLSTIVNELDE